MHPSTTLELPRVGKPSGQAKHPLYLRRPIVPQSWSDARTPSNQAAQQLFQWHSENYPGIEKGLYRLFKGRAKINTIRKWRNGTRRTPQWALALLIEAIENRIDSLQHARALLQKEKSAD